MVILLEIGFSVAIAIHRRPTGKCQTVLLSAVSSGTREAEEASRYCGRAETPNENGGAALVRSTAANVNCGPD
jgi:hypothetical protein